MKFIVMVEVKVDDEKQLAKAIGSLRCTLFDGAPLVTIAGNVVDTYPVAENVWDEDAAYPRSDWQAEAGDGDTNLGYWQWVASSRERDQE